VNLGKTAAVSDTGRKRRHNEDTYVLEPPVFAVVDGMGGANAGEVASALAAEALREEPRGGGGEDAVESLIQKANQRVYQRSSEDSATSGMGTTLTVALLEDDRVRFGHVGDSRAYLIRGGELLQLTEDHSLVGELVRSGKLAPEDAETHPQRSVITRALGTDPEVDVDTFTQEARPGDIFILCSDGLYSMVGDGTILDIVERNRGDLDAAARALVAAANRAGGDDNITVVAFEIASPADETARLPAPAPHDADLEDEDTLTEADAVPALGAAVDQSEERVPEPAPEPAVAPTRVRRVEDAGGPSSRRGALVTALLAAAIVAAVVIYLLWR
jgi:PPM family protein phosphatase